MRILFVNPAIRPDSPKCLLNVGLAYVLSALEREGFEFELLDIDAHRFSPEQVERQLRRLKYDAVGIGTLVSQYGWAKWLCQMIREARPNAKIVCGNTLGTSVPEILLERTEANAVCLGEGDETAPELYRALNDGTPLDDVRGIVFKRSNGEIVRTPLRPVIPKIDAIPTPNYDLFEIEIYLNASRWMVPSPERLDIPFEEIVSMPVSTARGCAFHCTFCFHAFQNLKYRFRSPESIVDEMQLWKERYGANHISFWDELSFYHAKATERLCDLLIERALGLRFTASCRSELLDWDTLHVAEKLAQAGCKGLGFALESGDESILAAMNKKNHVADFITQAKVCHAAGLEVYTSLVLGYPEETLQTITETFRVCKEANVYPSVGYLQPMPGTPMHAHALDVGAIADEEEYLLRMGDRQDLRVNICKALSDEQMEAHVHQELLALNEHLQTGLDEEHLIKTRAYRVAKSKSFLESFGQAARTRDEVETAC